MQLNSTMPSSKPSPNKDARNREPTTDAMPTSSNLSCLKLILTGKYTASLCTVPLSIHQTPLYARRETKIVT